MLACCFHRSQHKLTAVELDAIYQVLSSQQCHQSHQHLGQTKHNYLCHICNIVKLLYPYIVTSSQTMIISSSKDCGIEHGNIHRAIIMQVRIVQLSSCAFWSIFANQVDLETFLYHSRRTSRTRAGSCSDGGDCIQYNSFTEMISIAGCSLPTILIITTALE